MPTFEHDGLSFHYRDEGTGSGLPFVFQHGLGGDVSQPFGVYRPPAGVRMVAFDARAHGETRPLGDVKKIALAAFADDLVALLDHLGIPRAVVGGISMGAALALNAALRYPSRVLGLVLSRPAWVDRPLPENARVFTHVAQHILRFGAAGGLEQFRGTAEYQLVLAESPDSAASLERQFTQPRAEECVARLERIPHDAPIHDREELAAIGVPTLVLGNRADPLHPWEFAEALARLIPGADLVEITPKSRSVEQHNADVQRAVDGFLARRFLQGTETPPTNPNGAPH
jgi:pimeloyl-ACP methyl ester carboxylesterase